MEEDSGDDFVNPGSEAVSVVSSVNDSGRHVECQSSIYYSTKPSNNLNQLCTVIYVI